MVLMQQSMMHCLTIFMSTFSDRTKCGMDENSQGMSLRFLLFCKYAAAFGRLPRTWLSHCTFPWNTSIL